MTHLSAGVSFALYGQLVVGGMILALGLLNAVLGISLRDRVYLWYAAAMGAFVCCIAADVAGGPWHGGLVAAAFVVYFGAVIAFADAFLDLRSRRPVLWYAILASYALVAIVHLNPMASALFLLLVFAGGMRAARDGDAAARLYCIAFAGVVIGVLIDASGGYGLIPRSTVTDLAGGVGVAWEALFLALALADRIRSLNARAATLEQAAFVDALTGIPNRGAFEQRLAEEWRRAARARARLGLVLIDVDLFKGYNDAYGHPRGDRVLARVAAALAGALNRPDDFVARYGGEEFVVILPGCSREDAARIAESFRAAVRALGIPYPGSAFGRVTISAGVASTVARHDVSAGGLVSSADRALYAAKRDGRNRVAMTSAKPRVTA